MAYFGILTFLFVLAAIYKWFESQNIGYLFFGAIPLMIVAVILVFIDYKKYGSFFKKSSNQSNIQK